MIAEASARRFNPFPGLRSFEPDEEHLFFGREEQVDELLRRLRRARFLAVVGPSGSGKSSLVRSGLIPSLHSGYMMQAGSCWRVAVLRPGENPTVHLAAALARAGAVPAGPEPVVGQAFAEATLRRGALGLVELVRQARLGANDNLLVLVDQFEELFRFKRGLQEDAGDHAVAFVNLLLAAAAQERLPVYVVLTLRAEFLGEAAEFRGLAEAINSGLYLVPRMTREQRRSAITGPVAVGGADLTPRLLVRLLNDVGDNPDQLPILQHALMRTWDFWESHHADGEPLDLRHYEAIGTMDRALSLHAEEAYRELSVRGRMIAECLFKCLTERSPDGHEVRRPTRLSEVSARAEANVAEVAAVVERFRRPGRSFLTPPAGTPLDGDTVLDISHESLMRIWGRLIGWVEEETRSAQVYLGLAHTAALYSEGRAGLWRDPELQLALNWQSEARPNAAWAERYDPGFEQAMGFLDESRRARDRETAAKDRQQRRQLRRARLIALLIALVALAAAAVAVFAVQKSNEAEREKQAALEARQEIERQRGIALVQRNLAQRNSREAELQRRTAERALAAAESAQRLAESHGSEAMRARERALANERVAQRERQRAEEALASELEQRNQAEQAQGQAEIARRQAEESQGRAQRLHRLAVARRLAVESTLLPRERGRDLAALLALQAYRIDLHDGPTRSPQIDAALRQTLAALEPGGENGRFEGFEEAVRGIAWSPDGRLLAVASDDRRLRWLRPAAAGGRPELFTALASPVRALAWSPDGATLAAGTLAGQILLWQPVRGVASQRMLAAKGGAVTALSFRGDGRQLVAVSADGAVRVWEAAAGRELAVLRAGGTRLTAAVYVPRSGRLATGGADGELRLWDSETLGEPVRRFDRLPQGREIRALAASPDGRFLAGGAADGSVALWDLSAPEAPARLLSGHASAVTGLAFAGAPTLLASASLDGTVRLWSYRDPHLEPIVLAGHRSWVWTVAVSPGGDRVATGSADRSVRLWTVSTDRLAERLCRLVGRDLTAAEGEELLPGMEVGPSCPSPVSPAGPRRDSAPRQGAEEKP
jgi:energy-coupling factor transporter ATP-binding protein EcfA2